MMEMTKFRKEFKGTAAEFRDRWVRPFWSCLDENRVRYLKPFRDVMETIQTARERGVIFVIVSDAPFFMGLTRACDMHLDGPVSGLFALDCPLPHVSQFVDPEDMNFGIERMAELARRRHQFDMAVTLPKEFEKPNTGGLKAAMEAYNARAEESLFIGDNLKKDGGVARDLGMRFIWASYGLMLPPEYEHIIDVRITPTGEMPTNGHGVGHRPAVYPPMIAEATSYKTLLQHLGAENLSKKGTILNPSGQPVGHPRQRSLKTARRENVERRDGWRFGQPPSVRFFATPRRQNMSHHLATPSSADGHTEAAFRHPARGSR